MIGRAPKQISLVVALTLFGGTSGDAQGTTLRMATVDAARPAAQTMTNFANVVSANVNDLQVDVFDGGIGTLDMMALGRSVVHMSMVTPVAYDLMSRAEAMYVQESVAAELSETVQLIMWYPYGTYHFAVPVGSPAQSLDDLSGMSVFFGPHALSGPYHDATQWIEATTGLKAGADYTAVTDTWTAGVDAFRAGDMDVFVSACVEPCTLFDELEAEMDLRFLSPRSTDAPAVGAFFSAGRDPANTALPNAPDTASFATAAGIAVYADVDAQIVYDMTKAYWENRDQARIGSDSITLDYATTQRAGITMHPGALRYYQEVGRLD